MNEPKQTLRSKQISIRVVAILVICGLLLALPFALKYFSQPDITYQPVRACSMLTPEKAKSLLGDNTINQHSEPTINTDTRIATSKCSYTDIDEKHMSVIALAVQTGIDDDGVNAIHKNFAKNRQANQVTKVTKLKNEAFFNPVNGQLHVIDGHHWYIFSIGNNGEPASTTASQAIDFAKAIKSDI